MDKDHLLKIAKECIVPGSYTSHSGLQLEWRFDALKLLDERYPFGLYDLADALGILNSGENGAGIEFGGWMLAAEADFRRTLLVRKDGSVYGTPDDQRPTVLVDDVVTTGASMRAAQSALAAHGTVPYRRVCILDRRVEVGISDAWPIGSVFTSADFT